MISFKRYCRTLFKKIEAYEDIINTFSTHKGDTLFKNEKLSIED